MSIIINRSLDAYGNPNGVIDAPKAALFYKTGSFYKINYSGSNSTNWEQVYVKTIGYPQFAISEQDL